ncbi:MAG TPA: RDD family protein [Luteimonas sp.]|nr:RDD family protein [Luteimonas sp.]HRO26655.1 RDD family protein [Luteimonas sp.]HRP72445.1 RDD family protein [Luteimonas sp.]
MSARAPGHSAAPAAFLHRCAAWSIDMALLLVAVLLACASRIHDGVVRIAAAFDALVQSMARDMVDLLLPGGTPTALAQRWLAEPHMRETITALSDAIAATVLPPLLLLTVLALAWFTLFESSPWQATPGKRLLGLRVVDAAGARVGPARAALRHLAGALSWLTLNLGHLLALVPPRRQALHDRIARTRVMQEDADAKLPAWAAAWLLLQALAAVAATAWLFIATQAAMQRAFDALL